MFEIIYLIYIYFEDEYIFDDDLSSKPRDFLRDEVNQIIQNIVDLKDETMSNEDINTLSVSDTVSNVPCVVSINNPLTNKQSIIKSSEKEYVPAILRNRDRDIVKHLLAVSHFYKLGKSVLESN